MMTTTRAATSRVPRLTCDDGDDEEGDVLDPAVLELLRDARPHAHGRGRYPRGDADVKRLAADGAPLQVREWWSW